MVKERSPATVAGGKFAGGKFAGGVAVDGLDECRSEERRVGKECT